jgi:leader peptidase (prepilin peptidase)/N-methyltransferase
VRFGLGALAALAGLILGEGMDVIIYRFPRELPLGRRPRCTRCGHPLTWELLPLVGYLAQRGRCRHCHQPIPRFFPLVELLTAVVLAVLFLRLPVLLAGLYALFSLALIMTLFLDWLHRYIYYAVIVPAAAVALVGSLLRLESHPTILYSLLGLGIGVVFFGLLYFLGQILFHSQALGLGDVWLAGAIGAMAGFPGALLALAMGMVMAGLGGGILLLIRRGSPRDYMPYGSFLCLGALIYLCFWAPWSL